ncbi:hypothetical protein SKAU_G00094470 [Synaphobranchus kaupii]|uniref:ribonuclease H n=1 Tax=Synaphobranchus kaupii TaxID=118154 RepID=A0A9Q1FXW9_SYNKA|nr:hypothetical protein SKAU_G00094470 [Synaphobranchus kaupii]
MKLGVLKIGADISAVTDLNQSLQQQYPTVFQGVGKLKTKQLKLYIVTDVTPVAQPLRRIPFNLRGPVEKKIKELLDLDIIKPVDGLTPWVNPVVIVPKANSEIRLCLDMRQANLAIIRERYPIPTVDELLQGMNGSVVFSKLDLKWGYHQLELTPESREITTFAIHNGVYRYKRLLFGVSSASEQYQHEIAAALAGIEVHARDQETHDKRLHTVMKRLEESGLTLNPDKCQFNMDRLVFMGILLSEKGIGPTEERVRAVSEAREPENASEVRSFLGLVSYSSRFIPQFATLSEPLRRLTWKDIPFSFGLEQKQAFEALKDGLAKAGTLAYFDKDAPTKVIADAGPVGLGAVLVQSQKGEMVPVCYVSRALTDCERSVLAEKHAHGSDEYVRFVAVSATPKALTTREVEEASASDEELVEVRKAIESGHFEKCTAYALIASHSILVVVDYYSRYYEYDVLTSTTTTKVIDSLESIFSRHGLPVTLRSDQGPQFKSDEFSNYCESNGITHVKTTPRWAQANGEVERQNASLMKRIRIAESEGLDWKRELRKYVTVYRSIDHATTGKSPAELLFNRKIRGKLPDISTAHADLEVRDRDAEQKGKSKIYADERRGAKYSDVDVGDTVLVKQEKTDKLTTPFNTTPHKVVSKAGSQVVVESPTGARYSRNTTFVKKYTSARETPAEEETPQGAEDSTSNRETPVVQTPEQSITNSGISETQRPQRVKRMPQKLTDFVIK